MYRNSIFNPEDKLSELRKEQKEMEELMKNCKKTIQIKVSNNINMFKGLLCFNDIMFEEDRFADYSIFTIYESS